MTCKGGATTCWTVARSSSDSTVGPWSTRPGPGEPPDGSCARGRWPANRCTLAALSTNGLCADALASSGCSNEGSPARTANRHGSQRHRQRESPPFEPHRSRSSTALKGLHKPSRPQPGPALSLNARAGTKPLAAARAAKTFPGTHPRQSPENSAPAGFRFPPLQPHVFRCAHGDTRLATGAGRHS